MGELSSSLSHQSHFANVPDVIHRSDEHKFFKRSNNFTHKVGAWRTTAHPDKKKLPVQPRDFKLLPHSPCLSSVGDDDVTAKTRDNRNGFHDSDMF